MMDVRISSEKLSENKSLCYVRLKSFHASPTITLNIVREAIKYLIVFLLTAMKNIPTHLNNVPLGKIYNYIRLSCTEYK